MKFRDICIYIRVMSSDQFFSRRRTKLDSKKNEPPHKSQQTPKQRIKMTAARNFIKGCFIEQVQGPLICLLLLCRVYVRQRKQYWALFFSVTPCASTVFMETLIVLAVAHALCHAYANGGNGFFPSPKHFSVFLVDMVFDANNRCVHQTMNLIQRQERSCYQHALLK